MCVSLFKHYLLYLFLLCFSFLAVNPEMSCGSLWVLANINVNGYYRVNYDLRNWERLIAQLNSDCQVHSETDSDINYC